MRIRRIELFRYRPFVFNEVELFEMDMENDVQNIIGTNGSGKTSLLNELNPRPAARKSYGENGYKKIYIRHNNSDYLLVSDFSNPSAAHSFLKDGEELNSSGTTGVQEELIVTHLGYTTQVRNLCYGKALLSKMPTGNRKTYLMTIHPCQMKLVLEKFKKVSSIVRDCHSNLVMLHERKTMLETQLLDANTRVTLEAESKQLSEELSHVVSYLHKLNAQQSIVDQALRDCEKPGVPVSVHTLRSRRIFYKNYTAITRDISVETLKHNETTEISVLINKLQNLQGRIVGLNREIDKYEDHIRQNDAKGALESIESNIANLMLAITELEAVKSDAIPFEQYLLERIPQQINQLIDLVSFFIGYNKPIPSSVEVRALREKLQRLSLKRQNANYRLRSATEQRGQYEKQLHEKIIQDIPEGCGGCVLYRRYFASITEVQQHYDQTHRDVERTELLTKRLDLVIAGRSETLALYEMALPQLQKISDYLNEHRYLFEPLKDLDLLAIIRKNPTLLIIRLQQHLTASQNHYMLRNKRAELERLLLEQEQLKSPSEFSHGFLIKMVAEKQHEVACLHQEYAQYERDIGRKRTSISILDAYAQELRDLDQGLKTTQQSLAYEGLVHEKTVLQLYTDMLLSMRSKLVARLAEVDKTLRDQDLIQARYTDEVLVNIEKIKHREAEYKLLEKALSPTTGIPNGYMVQFLNDTLKNANLFLSEVFSYPFEFVFFAEDQPLDYNFKMRVRDVPIPDISEGSDAQEEMANFAFNLAITLQHTNANYPLMLDECGRTFDSYHKQKLVEFLKTITEDRLVPQLFLINHHATISAGLLNSDTVVLNSDNIVVPEHYNEHVHMVRY